MGKIVSGPADGEDPLGRGARIRQGEAPPEPGLPALPSAATPPPIISPLSRSQMCSAVGS
jgi:hypothetical protein